MKYQKEKDFEKEVKAFLKSQGCWVLKTWSNGVQREGIPDLLVCCHGYFLGIELKNESGHPVPLQLWNVAQIRKAGGIAIVLYPDAFARFQDMVYALKTNHNVKFWHSQQSLFDRD